MPYNDATWYNIGYFRHQQSAVGAEDPLWTWRYCERSYAVWYTLSKTRRLLRCPGIQPICFGSCHLLSRRQSAHSRAVFNIPTAISAHFYLLTARLNGAEWYSLIPSIAS